MISLPRIGVITAVCILGARTARPQAAPGCDCATAFARTVETIQTDYVAFPLEVPPAKRGEWDAHVARLRPLAAGADGVYPLIATSARLPLGGFNSSGIAPDAARPPIR